MFSAAASVSLACAIAACGGARAPIVTGARPSGDQGGMLSAEDADKKRTVIITAGASSGTTNASVTVSEKK